MSTTNLLSLDQKLLEAIGEYKSHLVTTNIVANKLVISTHLNNYTARDDYFNDWWIYIEDKNNAGVSRKVSDYNASSSQATVLGANFTADTEVATFRLAPYSWDNRKKALNDAIRETYPYLLKNVEDRTLITGQIIPDGSLEWWTSATVHKFMSNTNCTLAKLTAASNYRGPRSTTAMKVTATATNGYACINSDSWPRLLQLKDRDVTAKVWVKPEVANDAFIVMTTKQADGTAQTFTSTTVNPAGEFSLISLVDQTFNDDLVDVEIRCQTKTNAKYAIFDGLRVYSQNLYEYLLPKDLQNGSLSEVYIQTRGDFDDMCDDLYPTYWDKVWGYDTIQDADYKFLRLSHLYSNARQLRLIGDAPLEELDAATDTISLDGQRLNMLVEYAAYRLFEIEKSSVSSQDKSRYEEEAMNHLGKYKMLQRYHSMPKTAGTMKLPSLY